MMRLCKHGIAFISMVLMLGSTVVLAAEDGQAQAGGSSELKSLNQQISTLSTQIVDRQQGLESDLQKLLDQRRALVEMEKRVQGMIADQEDKLISQRMAIQEAEKQLDQQKARYLEQHRRLDELRASLESEKSEKESFASAQ